MYWILRLTYQLHQYWCLGRRALSPIDNVSSTELVVQCVMVISTVRIINAAEKVYVTMLICTSLSNLTMPFFLFK